MLGREFQPPMIPCGKALLQEWGVIKGKRGCESKKMSLFGLYFQHSDLPWVVGAYKRKIAFSLRSKQPRRLVIAGFQKKGKNDCADQFLKELRQTAHLEKNWPICQVCRS